MGDELGTLREQVRRIQRALDAMLAGGVFHLRQHSVIVESVAASSFVKTDANKMLTGVTTIDLDGGADALILDADGDTTIAADTDDQIDFEVSNADQIRLVDGALTPVTDNDVALGDTTHGYKNIDFTSGALRSHANSTTYTAYPVVPLPTPATSVDWDGDAKSGASGTIDLSTVFGLPAGIKGIFARITAKDETTSVDFGLAVTGVTDLAIVQFTQVANEYITVAGFVPCDANGDVYFYQGG